MEQFELYFCYRHIRLDTNEPFYIGIGKRTKPDLKSGHCSRAFKKSKRSKFWTRIVNKTNYDIEIIYESSSKEEICNKEKEFIKLYGRRDLGLGPLVNLTDGGEFFEGYVLTKEVREKRSCALKGRIMTKETINKIITTRRENGNYKPSFEARSKMSSAKLGVKRTKEEIKKREKTRKENAEKRGYYLTEEQKIKRSINQREKLLPYQRRIEVIELLNIGFNMNQVSRFTTICRGAISKIKKEYQENPSLYESKNTEITSSC